MKPIGRNSTLLASFQVPAWKKLVLVGDKGVGKTSLISSLTEGGCSLDYVPTEMDDCIPTQVTIDGQVTNISLWDTSGDKEFDRIRPNNYNETDAFLICFSIVNRASFESVRTRWHPEVSKYCPGVPIILIGTKKDLRTTKRSDGNQVSISDIQGSKLASSINAILYLECSALTETNSELLDAFDATMQVVLSSKKNIIEDTAESKGTESEVHAKGAAVDAVEDDYIGVGYDDDITETTEPPALILQLAVAEQSVGDNTDTNAVDSSTVPTPTGQARPQPKPRKKHQPPALPPKTGSSGSKALAPAAGVVSVVEEVKDESPKPCYHVEPKPADEPRVPRNEVAPAEGRHPPSSAHLEGSLRSIPTPEKSIYRLTSPQGLCLVFNMENYEEKTQLKTRHGSQIDVDRVKNQFEKLNFVVKVHQDLVSHEIIHIMNTTAYSEELNEHGCFVCFIMAHGSSGCIFCIDGEPLELASVTERFRANQCRSLRNKPKLFFIQACRGPGVDGEQVLADEVVPGSFNSSQFCPKDSDFLLCYANPDGYISFRDLNSGSPFLQTLCNVIEKRHKEDHILEIATTVCGYLKENPITLQGKRLYSVPETVTRLTKSCYLNPALANS